MPHRSCAECLPKSKTWLLNCSHASHHLTQHRDQFSRFSSAHGRIQETDRPTDRLTDYATLSVAIGRLSAKASI